MNKVRERSIAGELTLSIPPRISGLIREGRVSAHLYITAGGTDTWFRFTEPGKDVQSFTSDELIDELDRLDLSGVPLYDLDETTDDEADASPRGSIRTWNRKVERESASSDGKLSPPSNKEEAARMVRDRGLATVVKHGALNHLPSQSLTAADFRRNSAELAARAILVANARGMGKLWGTIGNQVDSYGTSNLKQWWKVAGAPEKARVLTSSKTLKVSTIPKEDLLKLNSTVYPF
jgi:hypothetical protein